MLTRRSLFVAGVMAGMSTASLRALAAADTILEVSGKLQRPDRSTRCSYSLADLDRLGTTRFTVHTPWYSEPCEFEGVQISRLMEDAGARGDTIRVSALNDYAADIPLAGLAADGPILASRRNGQVMPISDKGPLFVVYPFDAIPALQHQKFYSRSVWQVNRIEVL